MSLRRCGIAGAALLALCAATPTFAAGACIDLRDFSALEGCSVRPDGQLELSARALAALHYDADGNAGLGSTSGFHYVKRDGRQLAVVAYDNGPDSYAQGLVRGRTADGRIAYFDAGFAQAVPGSFDFAWPFEGDRAQVCQGCAPAPATPDGEHVSVIGGRWFHIDRRGQRTDAASTGPR